MSGPAPSIDADIRELVEEMRLLEDWQFRYEFIIELGQALPEFPEEWKTPDHEIQGCQSQVWVYPEFKDGRIYLRGTSDSLIVRGLVALLLKVYSGRTPGEILSHPPDFITEMGLDKHLLSTRSNGLNALIKRIFQTAEAPKA